MIYVAYVTTAEDIRSSSKAVSDAKCELQTGERGTYCILGQ